MRTSQWPVARRLKSTMVALAIGVLFHGPLLGTAFAADRGGQQTPATAERPAATRGKPRRVKPLTAEQTAQLEEADRLSNEALRLHDAGDPKQADPLFEKAATIRRTILGDDHPDVKVRTADDMARLGEAEKLFNDAVMRLQAAGKYGEAIRQVEKVLQMRREVLGGDDFISAGMLTHVFFWNILQRDFHKAESAARRASEYYKGRFGETHPMYAYGLKNLASIYEMMGDYATAEPLLLQSAAIEEKSFGADDPRCANTTSLLAAAYYAGGDNDKTIYYASRAAKLEEKSAMAILAGVSEVEALDLASRNLMMPNFLLSVSRQTKTPAGEVYRHVWATRGLVLQAIARRQESLRSLVSPALREQYESYLQVRRELARALLTPSAADPGHLVARKDRLNALADEKERLERDLAAQIPEVNRQLQAGRLPHTELIARLPRHAAFIDFVSYFDRQRTEQYAAFALAGRRPVIRVELGPAATLDAAVAACRGAINGTPAAPAAEQLRRLLWEPVEEQLPPGTRTIYLRADGALTSVPWAALQGKKPGSVLLEQYAIATVPSGQFLLEELRDAQTTIGRQGTVLAVGDVAYDAKPQKARGDLNMLTKASRAATPQNRQLHWQPLLSTADEVRGLARAARERKLVKLTGADASTARVLAELPKARWAHLATHGFFADPSFPSVLQADLRLLENGTGPFAMPHRTVAGRNPLVLSGLVLAGANLTPQKDQWGMPAGDDGILTAEAIAGLDLRGCESFGKQENLLARQGFHTYLV
ncbi:MAG: CHAT domain-containing protein [Thermoguttaceae bacterium]